MYTKKNIMLTFFDEHEHEKGAKKKSHYKRKSEAVENSATKIE